MGLDICIKTRDGDEETCESIFHIGYSSYHILMGEIARLFELRLGSTYYSTDNEHNYPEIDLSKLEQFKSELDYRYYENLLLEAGDKVELIPLLMHSDCDGYIPVSMVQRMIPLLDTDEVKIWFKLNSEWEERFAELVDAMKQAVSVGSDLIYL